MNQREPLPSVSSSHSNSSEYVGLPILLKEEEKTLSVRPFPHLAGSVFLRPLPQHLPSRIDSHDRHRQPSASPLESTCPTLSLLTHYCPSFDSQAFQPTSTSVPSSRRSSLRPALSYSASRSVFSLSGAVRTVLGMEGRLLSQRVTSIWVRQNCLSTGIVD